MSIADSGKVKLNIEKSKELIAEFSAYRDNAIIKDKKITALNNILEAQKQIADNFSVQYDKCDDNFNIKKKEASAWKDKYSTCIGDSIDCGELPWYKFDFKSTVAGTLLTLLLIGL